MIIFVYGDDAVRVTEKLGELRRRFVEKFDQSEMNVAEFSVERGKSAILGEVMQAVQSMPFLSEKRFVIIRGLLSLLKAEAKTWVEMLERTPESSIVVLVDGVTVAQAEKHEVFSALSKKAESHAYGQEKLEGAALTKWIIDRAKSRGASVTGDVATELSAMCGEDVVRLASEVDKLAAYAGAASITTDMLTLLVARDTETDMFAFLDALSSRSPKKTLQLLADERNAGTEEFPLFAMLARQVRLLLQVRSLLDADAKIQSGAIAKTLGVHPFVAQKTLAQARNFSSDELRALHDRVSESDVAMKRGGISPALAVDRLVAGFILAPAKA